MWVVLGIIIPVCLLSPRISCIWFTFFQPASTNSQAQALPVPAPPRFVPKRKKKKANFNIRMQSCNWLSVILIDTEFGKMYKVSQNASTVNVTTQKSKKTVILYFQVREGKGKEKTQMKRLTHMHTQPHRHSHQLEIPRMALFLNAEEAPAPHHPQHFPHQAQMAIQAGDLCPNSTDVLRLEIWAKLP
jgi:hypothetical protein